MLGSNDKCPVTLNNIYTVLPDGERRRREPWKDYGTTLAENRFMGKTWEIDQYSKVIGWLANEGNATIKKRTHQGTSFQALELLFKSRAPKTYDDGKRSALKRFIRSQKQPQQYTASPIGRSPSQETSDTQITVHQHLKNVTQTWVLCDVHDNILYWHDREANIKCPATLNNILAVISPARWDETPWKELHEQMENLGKLQKSRAPKLSFKQVNLKFLFDWLKHNSKIKLSTTTPESFNILEFNLNFTDRPGPIPKPRYKTVIETYHENEKNEAKKRKKEEEKKSKEEVEKRNKEAERKKKKEDEKRKKEADKRSKADEERNKAIQQTSSISKGSTKAKEPTGKRSRPQMRSSEESSPPKTAKRMRANSPTANSPKRGNSPKKGLQPKPGGSGASVPVTKYLQDRRA